MIYRFIALNSDQRGERITIPATSLTIGRGDSCDLRLNDPEVALVHAVVSMKDERLHISDRGSMNRILVNHREVRESFLKHGDMIELGQTRFLVQAYVQADVKDAGTSPEKAKRQWVILAVSLLLLVAATWAAIHHRSKNKITVEPAPIEPVATVSNPEPEVVIEPAVTSTLPISTVVDPTPEPGTATNVSPITPPAPIAEDPALLGLEEPPTVTAELPVTNPVSIADSTDAAPVIVSEPAPVSHEPVTPEPAPVVVTPAPEKDPLDAKVEAIFADAKAKIKAGSRADADELLTSIMILKPTFVPAHVERAKRFEEQGVLDMALNEWGEVVRLSPSSTAAKDADTAMDRLQRARRQPTPPFNDWIKIVSTDISKFPESADSREMRLLTICLTSGKATSQVDPSAVTVEVKFYDQDTGSGIVHPTRAKVPQEPLSVSGLWHVGETKTVTATYVIPMTEPAQRNYHYFGYEVRVYYQGALQTVVTEPSDLHQRLRAAAAHAAKTTVSRLETH